MINWGFSISQPRAINLDKNDMGPSRRLRQAMPELEACIACGACTATCTAGALTQFNFRRVHTLVRRGEYRGAYAEMNKCMMCGKCRLQCPRGINTRGVAMLIKKELSDLGEKHMGGLRT
jgi:heterodisulfide reductase subunit C